MQRSDIKYYYFNDGDLPGYLRLSPNAGIQSNFNLSGFNMSKKPAQLTINMFRDSPWPGNILSNFAQTPFIIDGVTCSCSEAFIQSLKSPNPEEQIELCSLQGKEAWERGSKVTDRIFSAGCVWWLDNKLTLHSIEHFRLVKRGLIAKFTQSKIAHDALIGSENATLIHEFGKPKGSRESLPIEVFCEIITEIRSELQLK